MIGTQFYKGQGLGNQLWAYATVRSLAEENGYDFGFLGLENFKGIGFRNLQFGSKILDKSIRFPKERIPAGFTAYRKETIVRHPQSNADVSPLDPLIRFLPDGTFIDGTFQTEKYFHDTAKVKSWFDLDIPQRNICVVSLRGGEFRGIPSLFLPRRYFDNAMNLIREIDSDVQFEVVTDDKKLAREWFPNLAVQTSGGVKRLHGGLYFHPSKEKIMHDFSAIQSARYLVLSNSSFSWWGAYSNLNAKFVIAPKYWASFNYSNGYWSNGDSLTSGWHWLDREGRLNTYAEALEQLENFNKQHYIR